MRIVCWHENCLPADNSHEISCLICYFWKSGKIFNCRLLQVIGGALRVNFMMELQVAVHNFQISFAHQGPELLCLLKVKEDLS